VTGGPTTRDPDHRSYTCESAGVGGSQRIPPRPVGEQEIGRFMPGGISRSTPKLKTRVLAVRPMHPCAIALVEDSHAHP